MNRKFVLFIILAFLAMPLFSFGVTFKMDTFPYKKYIFRMLKVPHDQWETVSVTKEGVRDLAFSYNGINYTCQSLKCGEIYMTSSDNKKLIIYIPIFLYKYKTITVAVPNEHKW